MKALISVLVSITLTGCATDSLVKMGGSTYDDFDGTYLDHQTNQVKKQEPQSEKEVIAPETLSLSQSRYASDKNLIQNTDLEKQLNEILDTLIAQWPSPLDQKIQVKITADRSYIASTSPNYILISQGILNDVESDDELAFILAHELSHIILEHHDVNEYFKKQSFLVGKATNIALASSVLGDLETNKTESGINVQNKNSAGTQKKIQKAIRTGATINRLSRDVISSSMTRIDEDEADLLGIDLLVKAGYSPTVYKTVLDRLESSQVFTKEQLKQKKAEFKNFVSMATNGTKHVDGLNLKSISYLAANEAATHLLQKFSDRHSSAADRQKDLAEYIKREYKTERKRPLSTIRLTNSIKSGNSQIIMQNYWYASEAIRAVQAGELKQAEELAKKSVSGITSGDAYPRLAYYMVRRAQGNMKKATQNLSLIKKWDSASIQTFNLAAEAYRNVGKLDDSETILIQAEKTIGVKAPFYPEYIRLYKESKRDEMIASTLNECLATNIDNIVAQCYDAAGIVPEQQVGESTVGFLDSMTSLVDLDDI